jgi:hypothetical protein
MVAMSSILILYVPAFTLVNFVFALLFISILKPDAYTSPLRL